MRYCVCTASPLPRRAIYRLVAGKGYPRKLIAKGGKPPYFWSVAEGALSRGLALNANAGSISGLPENPEGSAFRLQVSDRQGDSDEAVPTLEIKALGPGDRYSAIVSQVASGGGWRTAIHVLNCPHRWSP